MQLQAGLLLQVAEHAEEVARLRVAARPEHADQALGRCRGRRAQLLEADRGLDVVAQDSLAGVDIAGQHGVDPLAQQRLAVSGIACDLPLHQFPETPCQCNPPASTAAAGGAGNPPTARSPPEYPAAAVSWSRRSAGSPASPHRARNTPGIPARN